MRLNQVEIDGNVCVFMCVYLYVCIYMCVCLCMLQLYTISVNVQIIESINQIVNGYCN